MFGVEDEEELEFYEPYGEFLPRKQARLLSLWDWIGVPHEKRKQLHGRILKIIKFQVSLNDESRWHYTIVIHKFLTDRKHPLVKWQCVLGWANWFLNVDPLLRPGLQSAYAKI